MTRPPDPEVFGDYELMESGLSRRETMDEKWMGVIRHALGTIGVALAAFGYMDESTWQTVSGAILAVTPFIWSWKAKA